MTSTHKQGRGSVSCDPRLEAGMNVTGEAQDQHSADQPITGGCLCGGISFKITPPTLFYTHCHCRYCRKAHGAAVVTWLGTSEDRFELVSGQDLLSWYQSSKKSRRAFCSRCGTTLLFASTLCRGEVHVARAVIDGELDRQPQGHVFYDHHVPWLEPADDLPRYASDTSFLKKYATIDDES